MSSPPDPPLVTLIVPCRIGCEPRYALPQRPEVEVVVVSGSNVSYQRNHAAQLARGRFLYFLDDDCALPPESLDLALKLARELGPEWAAVGGPSLTHPQAEPQEKLFGIVLSLGWTALMTRPRNAQVGVPREVRGAELICCNLLVQRSWMERIQGFDVDLHPAEDVDFVQRLKGAGGRLLYRPDLVVWRHRRRHLGAFLWQYVRYGVARGVLSSRTHFRGQGLYLLPLALVVAGLMARSLWIPYLLVTLGVALGRAWTARDPALAAPVFLLIPAVHLSYGIGLGVGLVLASLGWSPRPPQVIERVQRSGADAEAAC